MRYCSDDDDNSYDLRTFRILFVCRTREISFLLHFSNIFIMKSGFTHMPIKVNLGLVFVIDFGSRKWGDPIRWMNVAFGQIHHKAQPIIQAFCHHVHQKYAHL